MAGAVCPHRAVCAIPPEDVFDDEMNNPLWGELCGAHERFGRILGW